MVNKIVQVLEHFDDMSCDICLVQETFLKVSDKAILKEITDLGWSIMSDPRKHRKGGGIAVLCKPDIPLKINEKVTKYKSYQIMEVLLNCETGLVRLVNVYRPPYTKKARYTESFFLDEFDEYLSDLILKPGVPIIAGDFNFHVERPTELYPKKLLDLISSYNLHQCVPIVPTHDLGGTLDLVITTKDMMKNFDEPIKVLGDGTSSDHYLVWFDAHLKTKPVLSEETTYSSYRNFKMINLETFKQDIISSDLGKKTFDCPLDDAISLYNDVLTELMDKHCPVKKKKMKPNDAPWRDLELRDLRRRRRAAERAWRKGKGSKEHYTELRKKFESLDFEKRCNYNKQSLEASSGDTKTLYKKLNRLLGNTSSDLPSSSDPGELSEDFKNFFAEKVKKIRKDIEKEAENLVENHCEHIPCQRGAELVCFSPITTEELKEKIKSMSNKFCGLDPIPTFLLKSCSDVLSPILLHIVNSSISTAEFPAELKKAVIKPTLKKEGDDKDCLKNYRPVSNLPVISKLLEKVVLEQLNHHLEENDLHCSVQSGYHPHHSCETLLVRMSDDIIKEIQADNIVVVVLLDLSAAFDTIDHRILLEKLLNDYNIKNDAHKWFKSYLESRSFSVKVKDISSTFLCLLFGVPQGSLLGPILFILYIKHLQVIAAKYGLNIKLYADDSQLYISFHPMRPSQFHDVTERINRCLAEIKAWMVRNFMKLNESKTELLVLGKTLVLGKCNLEVKIQFGDTTITPTECKGDKWTSLGVKLDKCMNMERQINSVRQKCYWTINNLERIGYYLDERLKIMMVKQLVISKLDYCNALYMNLPKTRLKRLESILNCCVRFIYNIKDRKDDLIPYYRKAHILPMKERIIFKVCLLSYKVVYNIAPVYLKQLIEMDTVSDSRHTRSKPAGDCLRMKLPRLCKTNASDCRFSVYAPKEWNALPYSMRSITNIDSFKKALKTFLFNAIGGST